MGTTLTDNFHANTGTEGCFDVEQFIRLKRVIGVACAPCGTWAAVALERLDLDGSRYAVDLWRVGLRDGSARQLTRGPSRDHSPCFRHDGALGFLSNRPNPDQMPEQDTGNTPARFQVWLLPADGGEAQTVSEEPLGVSAFRFARAANTLLLVAPVLLGVATEKQRETTLQRKKHGPSARHYTTMPVRLWDHWLPEAKPHLIVYDAAGRRDLTPQAVHELSEPGFDISADGQLAVVTWATPSKDRMMDVALLLIDLAAPPDTRPRILGANPHTSLTHPLFSPDASRIVCQSETRLEHTCPHTSLRLIDLASGQLTYLAPAWHCWPQPETWHDNGQSLFVSAEENGCVAVFQIELNTGDILRLTETGSHSQICFYQKTGPDNAGNKSATLLGIASSFGEPPELFRLCLSSSDTYTATAKLSGFDPTQRPFSVENLSVTSTDQHPVQAWLLKPTGYEGKPLPTLIWIHGGPIAAWNDAWHWRWNPLLALAQGYAVLLPNPRGSTGFGQAFIDGIWGNQWGLQCYEDLMAVVEHAALRPDLDAKRMAVMGGSFGGYMSNWIGTQTTRFKCLVSHAGVYSLSGFSNATDCPAYWYWHMDGEPFSDPGWFDRYAPARAIANWRTPTLIIHGDLDYRVSVNESLALFEALQFHGVKSELLIFPDENHWIMKPNNTVCWYQTIFEFLQGHI